jgi:hypothetical protein
MEAVAYLPSCLTRQVQGEPLSFDEILNKVFFKVAYSIHDEVCRTLEGKPTYAKWHCFLLLVDTFEIYAKTFPVATRNDNIAIMAALYGALRSIVPLSCLDNHAFQGLKFDDSTLTRNGPRLDLLHYLLRFLLITPDDILLDVSANLPTFPAVVSSSRASKVCIRERFSRDTLACKMDLGEGRV